MVNLIRWFLASIKREKGATAIEYALLVALIALVLIIGLGALGVEIGAIFQRIATKLGSYTFP